VRLHLAEEKQTNSEEVELEEEDEELDEGLSEVEDEPLLVRREFSIPKKIKITSVIIAVVVYLILGSAMLTLAIYYFVNPPEDTSTYFKVFAIFMALSGGFLLVQFPILMGRTLNNRLVLGNNIVKLRNVFNWKSVRWQDVQEVLIREKFKRGSETNEFVKVDIIRFRTISQGIHFMADSYPTEDAEQMISSIKAVFE